MLPLVVLRREQGRIKDIEDVIRAGASGGSLPILRFLLAFGLALGQSPDARLTFERVAAHQFADAPADLTRLLAIGLSAEACCIAGRDSDAEALYALLIPSADRHIQIGNGLVYWDSVSHMLGLLAAKLQRWEDAEAHLSDALQRAQEIGAVLRIAHIQYHFSQMLLARGTGADIVRARTLVEPAAAAAARFELIELGSRLDDLRHRIEDARCPTAMQRRARTTALPEIESEQPSHVFRLEGEIWTVAFEGRALRIKDARGLHYIATLLRNPGVHFHALELSSGREAGAAHPDRGADLADTKARRAYHRELRDLEQERAEAEERNDLVRAASARQQIDALTKHLASAYGLGGRARSAMGSSERARVNVTRTIGLAVDRIGRQDPAFGYHLKTSIRTGMFCRYVPDPRRPITWSF